MTIEDKAERYDELLVKLQEAKEDNNVCDERYCCVIDDIVPELKDGEGEKIRNWLIGYFRQYKEDGVEKYANGLKVESIIDWLEKQGEHKHQYKSRPRYVGEEELLGANKQGEQILANIAKTCKDEQKPYGKRGECLDCQMNYGGTCKGSCAMKRGEQNPTDKAELKFHKGDWVVTDKCDTVQIGAVNNGYYTLYNGMIFNMSYVDKCWHLWSIADADDGDVLACENGWTCIFRCLNDNLFSSHCFMDDEGWFCEYGGQGHTLDNSICGEIHPATKAQRDLLFQKMKEAGYEWLSGKKRLVKLLFKEGDTVRKKLDGSIWHINYINEHGYWGNHKPLFPIENQNEFELVEQKFWSEEDERIYQSIMDDTVQENQLDGKQTDWLRDIKYRHFSQPQTTWKPSDDQLDALHDAAVYVDKSMFPYPKGILMKLYKQLKKLK